MTESYPEQITNMEAWDLRVRRIKDNGTFIAEGRNMLSEEPDYSTLKFNIDKIPPELLAELELGLRFHWHWDIQETSRRFEDVRSACLIPEASPWHELELPAEKDNLIEIRSQYL